MRPNQRPRIGVERLEARDCPSLAIYLSGDNLYIRGTPTANSEYNGATGGLLITETATNTFQVMNANHNMGTYVADNITLNLTNHTMSSIDFNFNGKTDAGNIWVNLGTGSGDPTGSRTDGLAFFNGTLAGNLYVSGGGCTETVVLGQDTHDDLGPVGLSVLGNVFVSGKPMANSCGNLLDTGYNSGLNPTVFIGGNLTTSGYNGLFLDPNATVGGNLTVNGNGAPFNNPPTNTFAILILGKVGGNAYINGTPGSSGDNVFLTDGTSVGTVGGNFTANLGNGTNSVDLAGTIGGGAYVSASNGTNTIITGGFPGSGAFPLLVNNDLSIRLGNGNNVFTDASTNPTATGISSNTTVNGDLSVSVGNGSNSIGTIASSEQNDLNVTLGNGANGPVTITGPVGNTINYRAGNGGDSLTLDNPTAASTQFYFANALFGNGTNSLIFGDPAGGTNLVVIAGYFNGGNSGTNAFAQYPNASTASPFYMTGF